MATININIEKEDVININIVNSQQTSETKNSDNKEVIDELYKKLKHDLGLYNNKRYEEEHKHWWYEVFIDFDEDFDDLIYPIIKDREYEEQYTYCLGYMYKRDNYYFSPEYFDFLNEMVRNMKD